MNDLSRKLGAELVGTFILVFFAVGSAVFGIDKIGAVGVETAIAAANGKKVDARIDTGSFLVLPSNVDQFAKDSGVGQFMKKK